MSKKKSTHKIPRGVGSDSDLAGSAFGKSPEAGEKPEAKISDPAGDDSLKPSRKITLSSLVAQGGAAPGDETNIAGVFRAKDGEPGGSEATPEAKTESHDAWTADRLMRRSTPPPPRYEAPERSESKPPAPDASESEPLSWLPATPSEPSGGRALDLVDRSGASELFFEPADEMEELFALGDFSDALRIAELILGYQPDNEQAQRCAQKSRLQLEQLYSSKIGPLNQVPVIALRSSDLRWLGLDHRAGFVLSRIDGKCTVEELFEICSMPRLEVLKTVIELLNCGAIFLEKA